jgi:predicted nuclease with TOPRIM domain
LRYDEMIAELEREVRMVRERVKRLEQENSWLEEVNVRLTQTRSSTSNH